MKGRVLWNNLQQRQVVMSWKPPGRFLEEDHPGAAVKTSSTVATLQPTKCAGEVFLVFKIH
ncbi:MAG TPA: hypothetical protein DDW93_04780 [Firmicutes bacterium]|jgi:hypothetical protein|nr:hypothetical protein [Bacillota bacterium]